MKVKFYNILKLLIGLDLRQLCVVKVATTKTLANAIVFYFILFFINLSVRASIF